MMVGTMCAKELVTHFVNKKQNVSIPERYHLYDLELELKYWELKAILVESMQNYIDSAAPGSNLSALVLLNECVEENVDVIFAMCQGHVESHFGTRGIGAKTNGIFNVGAYDGKNADQVGRKFKYSHPNESIKPYLKLLNSKYLVNDKTEQDLMKSFVNSQGQRYASNKAYEKEISIKYNRIADSEIGDLYYKFLNYHKKLNY